MGATFSRVISVATPRPPERVSEEEQDKLRLLRKDHFNKFAPQVVAWTVAWALARPAIRVAILHFIPDASIRADLYGISLVHAAAIALFGWYKLLRHSPTNARGTYEAMALMMGYFVHDFVATQPDWFEYPADFFHHLVALMLALVTLRNRAVPQLLPSFMLVETSTIFLNVVWFFRTAGRDDHPLAKACMLLFVFWFFVTRIFLLPYATNFTRTHYPDEWKVSVDAGGCWGLRARHVAGSRPSPPSAPAHSGWACRASSRCWAPSACRPTGVSRSSSRLPAW